jgi:hypothetical protein
MYQPNFCSECGAKIIRLNWHFWHSRRFCDRCAKSLRKQRLKAPLLAAVGMFSVGLVTGRAGRPAPPPLVIERRADSPQTDPKRANVITAAGPTAPNKEANSQPLESDGPVYLCGARTKKGKPCSRRMHGPLRCWQHKGMPAMLPPEKLVVGP